jgi:hypothetical protein
VSVTDIEARVAALQAYEDQAKAEISELAQAAAREVGAEEDIRTEVLMTGYATGWFRDDGRPVQVQFTGGDYLRAAAELEIRMDPLESLADKEFVELLQPIASELADTWGCTVQVIE